MIARLIRNEDGKLLLLDKNGTISEATEIILANLLSNFKSADSFTGRDGNWSEVYTDMIYYPGETLACVTDNLELLINDFEPFLPLLSSNISMYNFISAKDYAMKHNKSQEIVKVLCRKGRILGAVKRGNVWVIPENAPYPVRESRQRGPSRTF